MRERREKILEEILAEVLPNFVINSSPQLLEVQLIPSRINTKENVPKLIMIKSLKTKIRKTRQENCLSLGGRGCGKRYHATVLQPGQQCETYLKKKIKIKIK